VTPADDRSDGNFPERAGTVADIQYTTSVKTDETKTGFLFLLPTKYETAAMTFKIKRG
jgi:hypothetical protein